MRLLRHLRLLLHRGRDAELREEMAAHREMLAAERGLSPAEAERAFGNELLLRERARDALGWRWVDDFGRDLKLALRQMRRAPGFTTLAVAILALGIGANTAVFSVIEAALLHPLPYPHPERIVSLPALLSIRIDPNPEIVPAPWMANVRAFASRALYESGAVNLAWHGNPGLSGGGVARRVAAAEVESSFFSVMGIAPLGRGFAASDERAGQQIAVISRSLARQWGKPSKAIGASLTLNGRTVTVVGVMPAGFDFPDRAQVWIPFTWNPSGDLLSADTVVFRQVARLRPGTTAIEAQRELVAASHAGSIYDQRAAERAQVLPLQSELVGHAAAALWLLLGAVGLVLLIACANVATLQSARALARQKEIAVRAALGAGRGRLLRQVLTECLLLAACAAGAGLILAWLGLPLLRAQIPATLPLAAAVSLDGRVLFFVLLAALVCTLLFGSLPVLHAWGVDLRQAAESTAGVSHERRWLRRTRSGLAAAEIALTLVLLAGAGLLLRSFARLTSVEPGFDVNHLWTAELNPTGPAYREPAGRGRFYAAVLPRLAALPGVTGAALSNTLPMAHETLLAMIPLGTEEPSPAAPEMRKALYRIVSPGFFHTMDIPLLAGRGFDGRDRSGAPGVAIVNRSLADALWPGASVLGRHLAIQPEPGRTPDWLRIVGVVGDTLQNLDTLPEPAIYLAMPQQPSRAAYIELRARHGMGGLAARVRRVVASVDPAVPVADIATQKQRLARSVSPPRFRALLLGSFAALALLLSVGGIFGVMAYSVTRRTAEIGIRMALGAQPDAVLWMILRQGMKLVLTGIAFGLAGTVALGQTLRHFVFDISPYDPATLGAAAVFLVLVATLACVLPARRAARVDPVTALRYE